MYKIHRISFKSLLGLSKPAKTGTPAECVFYLIFQLFFLKSAAIQKKMSFKLTKNTSFSL